MEELGPNVDERVLAFVDLIIDDWNIFPPETGFTVETVPDRWVNLVCFGVNTFIVLFEQQRWTLMDFDYSDSGLSLRLDRVTKLDSSYKNLLEMYRGQIVSAKRNITMHMMGRGIGTPRYQTAIGQFLKIALGSAFQWNSP